MDKLLDVIARAQLNGYVPDQHSARDATRGLGKHVDTVKKRQDEALDL